jgi:hypothetical protein
VLKKPLLKISSWLVIELAARRRPRSTELRLSSMTRDGQAVEVKHDDPAGAGSRP